MVYSVKWAKVKDFERSFYAGTPIESPKILQKR
jgi:hypothetical protein